MRKIHKFLSVILAIMIVISIIPITVSAVSPTSGTCGDNLIWNYDSSTYTLIISGTGAMYDYKSNNRPWEDYEDIIKEVIISDGATSIGAYAFYSCGKVASIIIPESIMTIGAYAFRGCYDVANIKIPNGVTIIGDATFSWCESLTQIIIPDSVTTIGENAFSYCENLESITIPNCITKIGDEAFFSCKNLTQIIIPDHVSSIGDDVFNCCDNLTDIIVDKNNQYYSSDEYGVLFNKDKTILIKCPEGNTETIYTIPDSVLTIEAWAFRYCSNLEQVIIPDSVTTIGENAFYLCDNLKDVKIGNGVTDISDWVFSECDNLVTVTIPDSVTRIGNYAFYWCDNITNVIFGKNVTSIGLAAFNECTNIKDVYYSGTAEQWNEISIEDGNEPMFDATIHYNYVKPFTGIKDNHFYKDNIMQKAYQLVEFEGDFYFIGDRHEIIKNKTTYLNEARINGLTYADGTPMTAGYYEFDADGKMVMREGIVGNHIYENNTMLKAYQLVEVDGDFYYIGDRHEIIKGRKAYVKEDRINGLTYADGTPITAGYYDFDENGKMVMLNGIVGNNIYKNNVKLKAYQLVEIDGDFYFIGDRHEIVKNKKTYLNEERINGLTYADGTPIAVGYYEFDENGKMIILNGIVGNNIYKNNTKLKAYQLVEIDGDFYFIGDRHEIVKDKKIYLNEERINGLTYADGTPIATGYHNVDADGKLIIE